MRARLALTLSGILLCTTSTIVGAADDEWAVDFKTVRVSHTNAIERDIDGSSLGDRIIFDIRRDNSVGVLSINCSNDRYSLSILGSHLVTEDEPNSNLPLAAQLSATYCPQIDTLPEFGTVPI
jgi:hypothetical protein